MASQKLSAGALAKDGTQGSRAGELEEPMNTPGQTLVLETQREAVARIVDPEVFEALAKHLAIFGAATDDSGHFVWDDRVQIALTKAEQIIALPDPEKAALLGVVQHLKTFANIVAKSYTEDGGADGIRTSDGKVQTGEAADCMLEVVRGILNLGELAGLALLLGGLGEEDTASNASPSGALHGANTEAEPSVKEALRAMCERVAAWADRYEVNEENWPPSPSVGLVYELLCSTEEPPAGRHWEGWFAEVIVAALGTATAGPDSLGVPQENQKPLQNQSTREIEP